MAEKIKIKTGNISKLLRALKALDGIRTSEHEVHHFDFSSSTAWEITKNQVILQGVLDIADAATKKLANEYRFISNEPITDENRDRYFDYTVRRDELLDLEVETEIVPLERKKLEEKNTKYKIPPSVMADLWPILAKEG